ncbi:MAG: sel1 repeat family protein [Desulfomonile tiedjei]|uniref:Sel1 repeat family protein n=1 Tax=Desulfomonile tiedjei TaxID=2358 RepID=A0A9D6Z3W9_9BACT|nr:sel1 repeat family protein [Desulfomonile tiedjei]
MIGFLRMKSSNRIVKTVCSTVLSVMLSLVLVAVSWSAEQQPEKSLDPIEQLRSMAEKGSAEAQTKLADLYKEGKNVAQNLEESAKWYKKAAEQGFAEAQHKLGELYLEGKGVVQNSQEAVKWLQKSADQGYTAAKERLSQFASKTGEALRELTKPAEKDKP